MEKYYTFHKTERGHLHILKEIPCEDFSGSYSDEQGQFCIAAVADGHGDSSCMRSETGSRLAVEAAITCLTEYARQPRKPDIHTLTSQIVDYWCKLVEKDLVTPFSEEELKKSGIFEDIYRNGERLKHAYGTTLIAALMLPDSLILVQQGDGRCDVFYEDGTVDQPIPWDEKCHENVTTSMCDEDAAERIRSQVLDLTEKKVIACYLGSDGVEDSYRNMEGTHIFYRDLTCRLNDLTDKEFNHYLEEMLPPFSRQGSGDDVSVGGIVDLERIKIHVPSFRKQIKKYGLEEELARYESRKISMSRKHGILKKRMEEAKRNREDNQQQAKARNTACENAKSDLRSISENIQEVRKTWRLHDEQLQLESPLPLGHTITIHKHMKELDQQFRELCSQKDMLVKNIHFQEEKLQALRTNAEDIKVRYQTAKKNFEEYDAAYQNIESSINRIQREIAALQCDDDNSETAATEGTPAAAVPLAASDTTLTESALAAFDTTLAESAALAAPTTTADGSEIPSDAPTTTTDGSETSPAIPAPPSEPVNSSDNSDLRKLKPIWKSLPNFSLHKKDTDV